MFDDRPYADSSDGHAALVAELEAVRRKLCFLETMVETLPVPLFAKNEEGRFCFFNKAYEEYFGVHREDLLGLRVLDLHYLEPEARERYQKEDLGVISDGGTINYETTYTIAQKVRNALYWSKGFRISPTEEKGLVGMIVDISDTIALRESKEKLHIAYEHLEDVNRRLKKELSKEQSIAEAAHKAEAAKSAFLANMSHEIRTPLNAVVGMTAIGKRAVNSKRKDFAFGRIEAASRHLLAIINDVLDMAKIESGKMELMEVEFNFEKLVRNVTDVMILRIAEKNLSFSVHIDTAIPSALVGDPQRLTQVLTNLLSNAVKFTPEAGSVHLDAALAEVGATTVALRVCVKDSGIGIDIEQQIRLFQPFQQAESGTSRTYGGTGLGLSISKHLIELMGGQIGLESALGQGASFYFTVPLKRGRARLPALRANRNWKNVRVLAVDDDPDTCEVFAEMARNLGITCDVANGAENALALVNRNGHYDIYFIDWRMPDLDGLELSRQLKKNEENPSFIVIMISSSEWADMASEAQEAGVDRFLQKPFFQSAVADVIDDCLGLNADGRCKKEDVTEDIYRGRTLLLAEDVAINREILLMLLEPTGIAIECAENGREAVELFRASADKYDIIFMDMQMPEMDGLEATRRIRALNDPWAKSIPIVAMTANVFKENIKECLAAGMDDHLGKPLDVEKVLDVLNKNFKRQMQ